MATRLLLVSGARPNFMKVAPILRVVRGREDVTAELVHTGQHYDEQMAGIFFDQLGIGRPEVNLGVGSGTHAEVTGRVMIAIEPVLKERNPDVVIVVGDVNSTLAAALAAVKLHIPVAHVEAGLRSFDRTMPEEINRRVTDAISDVLFVTEPAGEQNLMREGVPPGAVHHVGNTMIDTLMALRQQAEASDVLERLSLERGRYAVLTLHRPGNVDDAASLRETVDNLIRAAERLPVVFPIHPRTRAALERHGLAKRLEKTLRIVPPAGYLDFLKLMSAASVVLTDSGGIQEETTALGVPCLTLRDNTERPATLEQGTNRLVGAGGRELVAALDAVLAGGAPAPRRPELWDGRAGERIVDILAGQFGSR